MPTSEPTIWGWYRNGIAAEGYGEGVNPCLLHRPVLTNQTGPRHVLCELCEFANSQNSAVEAFVSGEMAFVQQPAS